MGEGDQATGHSQASLGRMGYAADDVVEGSAMGIVRHGETREGRVRRGAGRRTRPSPRSAAVQSTRGFRLGGGEPHLVQGDGTDVGAARLREPVAMVQSLPTVVTHVVVTFLPAAAALLSQV